MRNTLYPKYLISYLSNRNKFSLKANRAIDIANYYLNKKCSSLDFHASKESYFFPDFVLIYMYIFIIFSSFMFTYKEHIFT